MGSLAHENLRTLRYNTRRPDVSLGSVRALRDRSQRLLAHIPTPRATPLTYVTVGLLLLTSVMLHTHPDAIDGVVGWASTNVQNLTHHPIAATVASAFVVPSGLFPDLLIVAVSFAVLERAIGTARTLLVAVAGHVVATVFTEGAVGFGISIGALPISDAVRSDVGISYVMYAVVAASIFLLRGLPRTVAVIVIVALVGIPAFSSRDMTAFGHLSSVAIGFAVISLMCRGNRNSIAMSSVPSPRPTGTSSSVVR
jgi:hypothetical protein